MTEGKNHDVTVGRILNFPKGGIIAIDKAYNDYAWYKPLIDKGIFFVTCLKSNAQHRVVSRRPALNWLYLFFCCQVTLLGYYSINISLFRPFFFA